MVGEWIDFSQFVEEHVMYVHVPLNARVFLKECEVFCLRLSQFSHELALKHSDEPIASNYFLGKRYCIDFRESSRKTSPCSWVELNLSAGLDVIS